MSVVQVTASQTKFAQTFSAYGGYAWWPGPYSNVPAGAGAGWVIWQFGIAGLPANEPFNGVTITGNNKFIVGNGAGITRNATLYTRLSNAFAFDGTSGGVVATYPGTGASQGMNTTLTNSALSSNDLIAGNCFIGVAFSTSSLNPSSGDGVFTYGGLNFQFYTGTDSPNPPATQPAGKWKNPADNTDPGAYPGDAFESINYRLTSPLPQTFMGMQFQIIGGGNASDRAGITFPNGSSTSPLYSKGAQGADPSHPYDQDTGLIAVASTVRPNVYSIRCTTTGTGVLGGSGFYDYSSLTVRQRPSSGIILMEF